MCVASIKDIKTNDTQLTVCLRY